MDDYITPGVEHLASKYNILHGKEYKPVYGYINVPSFKVNNQRYSIENQEQSIREYCYRKQLQLTNIFVEDSSNCRLFDRTELSKLLLLLDNPCTHVIIYNVNCLIFPQDQVDLSLELLTFYNKVTEKHGKVITSEGCGIDMSGEMGRFIFTNSVGYAAYKLTVRNYVCNPEQLPLNNNSERQAITSSLVSAHGNLCDFKSDRIRVCPNVSGNRTPYGWVYKKEGPVEVEEEQLVIDIIYELNKRIAVIAEIIRKLDALGIRTPKGAKMSSYIVTQIMRDNNIQEYVYNLLIAY